MNPLKAFNTNIKIFLILALICTSYVLAQTPKPVSFYVKIKGIKSSQGKVRVALYNKRLFLKPGMAVNAGVLDIENLESIWQVRKVDPGEYAILAFHDLNDNMKLDKNFFGKATEPYAFSVPHEGWGTPKFDEVKFQVDSTLDTLVFVLPQK